MPPLCCTECNSTDLAYDALPSSTPSSFPQPTSTHPRRQEGGDLVCQACGYVVEEEAGNPIEEGAIRDDKTPASDSLHDQKNASDLTVSGAALVYLATRSSIPTLTLADICDCNSTGSSNRMRGTSSSSGSGRLSKLEVGRRAVHLERAMLK